MRKFWLGSMILLLFSLGFASSAQDEDPLRIGYLPIMVMEQHFVAVDQGWYDELGIDYESIRFQTGPAIVQAFAANELDIAYVGINPALVMIERGIPVKVVAANVVDGLVIISNDQFAEIWAQNPSSEAFALYEAEYGSKLSIATLAPGSTPHTVLLMWLEQLGANVDDIELITLGLDQVQAALAVGQVDASLIMEPIITLAQEQDWGYSLIVSADEVLVDQPGAVFVVSEALIENNPELVEALVDVHVRATIYATNNLDEAARIASEQIGPEILSVEVARVAVESPALQWISSPYLIIDSTLVYNNFQVEIGVFDEPLTVDEIFDTRFFDAVIEANPAYAEEIRIRPYVSTEPEATEAAEVD